MSIGIYLENCDDVTVTNNRFHNVQRPVVARNVRGLKATGNTATYGSAPPHPKGAMQTRQQPPVDGFRLRRLTVAIREIYRV